MRGGEEGGYGRVVRVESCRERPCVMGGPGAT